MSLLPGPLRRILKGAAGAAGFHVVRQSQNPQHTLMGLKRFPIKSIFDVGANEGQFAALARQHFPLATLYCFEPLPDVYRHLCSWAKGREGVQTFNFALGDHDGVLEMHVHQDHTPSSSLLRTTALSTEMYPFTMRQEQTQVSIKTLNDVVAAMKVAPEEEILVKLDVQGFEDRVLRGADVILSRARACIVEVTLDELYVGQCSFRDVFLELDRASLRYAGNLSQVCSTDGHVIYLDALFLR